MRWCALVLDGVPLTDHFTDDPHFDDMAALAIVLVCALYSTTSHLRRTLRSSDRHR